MADLLHQKCSAISIRALRYVGVLCCEMLLLNVEIHLRLLDGSVAEKLFGYWTVHVVIYCTVYDLRSIKLWPGNVCTCNRLLQVKLCEVKAGRKHFSDCLQLNNLWIGGTQNSALLQLSLEKKEKAQQTFIALRNALFLFPMFMKEHKYVNDSLVKYSNTC